jgi:hypothetical protein
MGALNLDPWLAHMQRIWTGLVGTEFKNQSKAFGIARLVDDRNAWAVR